MNFCPSHPVLPTKCWRCLPLPQCPRVSPWMCLLMFLVQKKSDLNSANSLITQPNLEHHPSFLPSPPQSVSSQPGAFCSLHLSALLPLLWRFRPPLLPEPSVSSPPQFPQSLPSSSSLPSLGVGGGFLHPGLTLCPHHHPSFPKLPEDKVPVP